MDPIVIPAGAAFPQPRIVTSDNGARSDTVLMNGQPVPVSHAQLMLLADIRDLLGKVLEAVQRKE